MELHDIVTSLLDQDGSCRDLNFEQPSWAGVERLLRLLETNYVPVSGNDHEGEALSHAFRSGTPAAALKGGFAHLRYGEGEGLIKNLQVFISAEEDGLPFIELTFFPEDVCQTSSLRDDFIAWIETLQSQLEAQRYFARYENASWRLGDIGEHSGVFLVSDDLTQDA